MIILLCWINQEYYDFSYKQGKNEKMETYVDFLLDIFQNI